MSHSRTIRRAHLAAVAGGRGGSGRRPVRSEPRSVRRRSMCAPRRSRRGARSVRRIGAATLELGHQPVRARPARPARARRSACRAGAPRRTRATGGRRPRRARSLATPRRPRAPRDGRSPRAPGRPRAARPVAPRGRSSARRGRAASAGAALGSLTRRRHARRRRSKNTAIERLHLRVVGDEHGARRPVQARARVRPRQRRARRRSGADRSAVTGTPASRRRRPNAAASGEVEPDRSYEACRSATSSPGRRRTMSWSSAYLRTRAERAVDRRLVELGDRRAAPAPRSQSIASAMPGGFWTSRRAAGRPRRRPAVASASATPRTRRRTMSSSRSGDGVVEPLVQAAALERVVQVARAVARSARSPAGARRGSSPAPGSSPWRRRSSSSRKASKSSSARSTSSISSTARPRPRVLERLQQGPRDQVGRAPNRSASLSSPARRLGRAGSTAAAADSSTRTAPRRRRCRRSTAGGSAACPAAQASARAASVFPTPGLALEQQGLRKAKAEEERGREPSRRAR